MALFGDDRYYPALGAETRRFADTLSDADLTRQVPSCPEWTLIELTAHLGAAHRWVGTLVAERATGPTEAPEPGEVPAGAAELSRWVLDGAARLADAVREAGLDATVWSWADEQSARFWLRRMVHETLVHRVDAELTVGREPALDPDVAADAVSEWLGFLSSPKLAARRPPLGQLLVDGETVHLHATDDGLGVAGEWLVRGIPSGLVWEHGHAKGDVAVRGTAAELLLVIMRRLPPERVQVFGDRALLDRWLEPGVLSGVLGAERR